MAFVFPNAFHPQPVLEDADLCVRPMVVQDRDALARAASDPLIWAGHPVMDRHTRAQFDPYFDMLLASDAALVICKDNNVIGCSAYYTDTNAPTRLSIGFTFLERRFWGGAINRRVKRLMLGHIFETASEAWFHIAPSNLRSQTATQRLGAVFMHEDQIDLGGAVQPWICYCLTRQGWAKID